MNREWSSGQNFAVSVGDMMMSFAKISNLKSSVKYQKRTTGGMAFIQTDESVRAQGMEVLTLERGYRSDQGDEVFWHMGSTIDYMTIFLFNYQGEIIKVFGIDNGVVVKHTYSDLDASGKHIFTEKIEIAHLGLIDL